MKIYNINMSRLSFGHYLDNEKSEQQRKLSSLNSEISRLSQEKSSEQSRFSNNENELNNEIQSLGSQLRSSKSRISSLEGKVYSKSSSIDYERSLGSRYSETVSANNKEIEKLQATQKEIYGSIAEQKRKISEQASNSIVNETAKLQENYVKESKYATEGLKSLLVQNIINPAINAIEGEDDTIPASILIQKTYDDVEKKNLAENAILEWIAKCTDSNYANVDAAGFTNETSFVNHLKKIMMVSAQEFERNGQHSFTLVSNIDTINLQDLNEADKNFLSKFLSQTINMYHNTIIAISKVIPQNFLFKYKFILDKTFIDNKRFGLSSLLDDITEKKYNGINILTKLKK